MKWTKQHSLNAVAAKQRKRMAEPDFKNEVRTKIRMRRSKAKWQLQLRDLEHGDSLTVRLFRSPWPSQWIISDRAKNLTDLFKKLKLVINQAA